MYIKYIYNIYIYIKHIKHIYICVGVFVCMEYIFFMTGTNPSVIASSVFKRRSSPYVLKRLKQS